MACSETLGPSELLMWLKMRVLLGGFGWGRPWNTLGAPQSAATKPPLVQTNFCPHLSKLVLTTALGTQWCHCLPDVWARMPDSARSPHGCGVLTRSFPHKTVMPKKSLERILSCQTASYSTRIKDERIAIRHLRGYFSILQSQERDWREGN